MDEDSDVRKDDGIKRVRNDMRRFLSIMALYQS